MRPGPATGRWKRRRRRIGGRRSDGTASHDPPSKIVSERVTQTRVFGTALALSDPGAPSRRNQQRVTMMQISSVSNAYGQNQNAVPLDPLLQQPDPAGQNLPVAAQAAQSNEAAIVSSPRASLTASATAVLSQSVDDFAARIDTSRRVAAYQSYMNTQGIYGYQATLGAPTIG